MKVNELLARWRALPRAGKIASWVAAAYLFYLVLGFLVLPPIVRAVLAGQLAKNLHRPAAVKKVRLNPLTLSATIEGLSIKQRQGENDFVSFGKLYVNVQASSLFKRALIVKAVQLADPHLAIIREDGQRYNFSDLIPESGGEEVAAPAKPLGFSINNIEVQGGAITFEDRPQNAIHTVRDLALGLPFVSNLDHLVDIYVQPSFAAVVNDTSLALQGKTKPFADSRETSLAIKFPDCNLARYFSYLPSERNFDLSSGRMDIDLLLTFVERKNKGPLVKLSGDVALREIGVLDADGAPLLGFDRFGLSIVSSDLFNTIVHVGKVELAGPYLELRRNAEGRVNLWHALALPAGPAAAPETSDAGAPLSGEIRVDSIAITGTRLNFSETAIPEQKGAEILALPEFTVSGVTVDLGRQQCRVDKVEAASGRIGLQRDSQGILTLEKILPASAATSEAAADSEPTDSGQPWQVRIDTLSLQDFAVQVEDLAPRHPVHLAITDIAVTGRNVTTGAGEKTGIEMGLTVAEKGRFTLQGELSLNPLAAEMTAHLKALPLAPLQNYLRDSIDLLVAEGSLDVESAVSFSLDPQGKPAGRAAASLAVNDLRTLDGPGAEPLFSCRQLQVKDLVYELAAGPLAIDTVSLADFSARLAVDPDGTLNLKQILVGDAGETASAEAPEAPPSGDAESFQYRITTIALAGGRLDILDQSVSPAYATTFSDMRAELLGLASNADQAAALVSEGIQDGHSPFSMKGSLKPGPDDFAGEIAFHLGDFDMTTLSPYSGKFIGNRIQKGKLALDLGYRVENGKLAAQNRIFLDQLTLGESVESPDALSLPIGLALALLRNRSGEIHLNVPISGDLNDPEFSLAGTVFTVFFNLIAKAATSPFALLGALLPEGTDLHAVDFAPGRADLAEAATAKLDTLATILYDRPGLKVELAGRVDPAVDRPALHELRFSRLLKSEKVKDTIGKGTAVDLDTIEVGPKEYELYLWKAYKEADFKKERNFIGMVKKLPAPEMEALLRGHITIGDNDLQLLAERRAAQVRGYLLGQGKVEAERIFLVEATDGSGQTEEAPDPAVTLGLK